MKEEREKERKKGWKEGRKEGRQEKKKRAWTLYFPTNMHTSFTQMAFVLTRSLALPQRIAQ